MKGESDNVNTTRITTEPKKYQVNLTWRTNLLFNPTNTVNQNQEIIK